MSQLLHGIRDLPGSGLQLVFPALAGRFFATKPPGKPGSCFYIQYGYLYFNLECFAYFNVLWFWIWWALIPLPCCFLFLPSIFWFIFPSYSDSFWINWIYFIISFYLHCWLISCNSLLCYFSGCFNLLWFTFKRYYATSRKIWEPFNSYFYFSSSSLCYCCHTFTST